jgi:peptide deformylase
MSETLIIDTSSGVSKEIRLDPLPLYDEKLPMLDSEIPEYTDLLPNERMNNLIKRMKMTMKQFGGIGLSANQCGVYERVFIIGTDQFQIVCINPKVIKQSENMVKDNEGCLSFPGFYVKIERPSWVDVEFTDETGQTKQMHLEGLTARCFMHELDHMNGIKFTKYVGPVAIQMARKKQEKIMKKIVRSKNNALFV